MRDDTVGLGLRTRRYLRAQARRVRGMLDSRQSRRSARELYRSIGALRRWTADDVVLDVGANVGQTVLGLRPYTGATQVLAFEPVSATFAELARTTAHLPQVRRFNLALGSTPGQLTIHHHPSRSSMSTFRPWWEATYSEEVEVSTIDRELGRSRIEFVHLLKIDTEGFELEVLRGASDALDGHRIAMILVEVGLDRRVWPWTCFEDVREFLCPRGYFLHGFFEQNRVTATPPAEWNAERRGRYSPTILQRCNALFLCAVHRPPRAAAS
jgi:FkbM family methyltransferase